MFDLSTTLAGLVEERGERDLSTPFSLGAWFSGSNRSASSRVFFFFWRAQTPNVFNFVRRPKIRSDSLADRLGKNIKLTVGNIESGKRVKQL